MLEVRFTTMFIGSPIGIDVMGSTGQDTALAVIAITLCLLIIQAVLKPYMETAEEAAHWSSPNKMGIVGYLSQLVVLVVGVLSIMFEDSQDDAIGVVLSLVAAVALVLPLGLTGTAIVQNKDEYVGAATNVVHNILGDSDSEEENPVG